VFTSLKPEQGNLDDISEKLAAGFVLLAAVLQLPAPGWELAAVAPLAAPACGWQQQYSSMQHRSM
jgi:hypothetical protein